MGSIADLYIYILHSKLKFWVYGGYKLVDWVEKHQQTSLASTTLWSFFFTKQSGIQPDSATLFFDQRNFKLTN